MTRAARSAWSFTSGRSRVLVTAVDGVFDLVGSMTLDGAVDAGARWTWAR